VADAYRHPHRVALKTGLLEIERHAIGEADPINVEVLDPAA